MHHRVQTIIDLLDGKPRGGRGQSFIELAVTAPILVLMIMALAEIGFVANNYLILMDLVRESGRRGANLNPTLWNENQTRNYERLDCDTVPGVYNFDSSLQAQATPRRVPRGPSAAFGYSTVYDNPASPEDPPFGYFDAVVCQGAFSMAPLEFEDQDWGPGGMTTPPRANLFTMNDIVVSAISYT
ncbi:MAG: pilus assembly protein, partial [Anaerolineae bacterium]|nr:pilus assembly protein [Anaerolineae bacterium]